MQMKATKGKAIGYNSKTKMVNKNGCTAPRFGIMVRNINWLRIATTATRATTTTTTTTTSLSLAFINTCLLLFVDHDMHFFNVAFSNSYLAKVHVVITLILWPGIHYDASRVLQIEILSSGGFRDGKYFASNLTSVDCHGKLRAV